VVSLFVEDGDRWGSKGKEGEREAKICILRVKITFSLDSATHLCCFAFSFFNFERLNGIPKSVLGYG